MKRVSKVFYWMIAGLLLMGFGPGSLSAEVLTMSTTTSTVASGLLDVLLPELEKDTGIQVKVIAKGTGAAIRDGIDGNVDVIFVHAKEREEAFVKDGYGTRRYAVMHNDFVIVGPPSDPAGIRGMKDAGRALATIATRGYPFISRGDDSGTHTMEQHLWRRSGVAMQDVTQKTVRSGKEVSLRHARPSGGNWYQSIGQGMGKVLTFADEKQAYTLTDRGTYINYRYGRDIPVDLEILCEGDEKLANPYGVIPVNPAKHPHVKYELAETFARWLVSNRGQSLINGYQLLGKQLFFGDAQ
jgi:tungstate transport system substrate-binding protein